MAFNLNIAKSLLGKNINLHLKDGSVIVNVQLAGIHKDPLRRKAFVKCSFHGGGRTFEIPLRDIAWAKLLDSALIHAQNGRANNSSLSFLNKCFT